jgi:CS domain
VIKLTASARRRNKKVWTSVSSATFIHPNHLEALPYSWKQTLEEVDIVVPVPKGTRARDLVVVIAKTKLNVGLKGKDPIMAGDLCQEIKVEESTWTLG